jgi:predicted nucleic acid-binding Zn ribbon protein
VKIFYKSSPLKTYGLWRDIQMFCSKCGKEIPQGGSFCSNCGATTEQSNAPAQSVNLTMSRSALTGLGAIALIVLLLQRMMGVPLFNTLLGLVGAVAIDLSGMVSEWFSFFDFMRAANSLRGAIPNGEGTQIFLIAGFYFVFMLVCIAFLGMYLIGLAKNWGNAQRIGKTAFLLTAIFAVVVFVSGFLLNMFLSRQLGEFGQGLSTIFDLRAIQFRWTFYAMGVLAIVGWFFGFKNIAVATNTNQSFSMDTQVETNTREAMITSENATSLWLSKNKKYLLCLAVFGITEAMTFIMSRFFCAYVGVPYESLPFFFIEFVVRGIMLTGLFIFTLKTEGIIKAYLLLLLGVFIGIISGIAVANVIESSIIYFYFSEFSTFSFFGISLVILVTHMIIGLIGKLKLPQFMSCIVIGVLFAGMPHLLINLSVWNILFLFRHSVWYNFVPALFISPIFGAVAGAIVHIILKKLKRI